MFGYLVAAPKMLEEQQLKRYTACYCGLCRSLKQRHGELSRLTLNYDMTLLVLILGGLYEPEELSGVDRCIRHPKNAQDWVRTEATDYAADMNVALAYLKCLDDWDDEGKLTGLAGAKALKQGYEKIKAQYPRQCGEMEKSIAALRQIEREKREAPDEAADCFGRLMGEIFVWKNDRWSDTMYRMAHALGRTVYLMDACMDLDRDAVTNSYNPFRRYYGLDNEQRFRDILKMQLGECVYYFDKLPIVQDAMIIKNILCDGLWTQFDRKYKKEGKDS